MARRTQRGGRPGRGALVAAASLFFAADASAQAVSGYVPHRVYDVRGAAFIDFETLAARGAAVDVVFFGELHGHEPGHRLQHALLEALQRRGGGSLSLEMFERDVAELLDAYVAGTLAEGELLAGARPWPRYASDYRPLVEHARAHGWPVSAANAPRALASLVGREGLAAIAMLPPQQRRFVASELVCPDDAYRARFIAEMQRHPMGPPGSPEEEAARAQRFYEAQCIRDETMAESIVALLDAGAPRPIVHVTGAFHTDHGDGIPDRVLRRRVDTPMLTVTLVPVADLDALDPAAHRARADYLLFTLRPDPAPSP
jgi:uncharacterized iron-regulated protein